MNLGETQHHASKKPMDQRPMLVAPVAKESLIRRLLSPESLQQMMAASGLVFVLGIVAWLWSEGIFEAPLVMATGCGLANLAIIAIGCTMVLLTRFQLAGTGVTLLGCLALPLNLWLYDAQELITLQKDGHLWIPSAMICGLYAAVARLIKDSKLVYAFIGGIILTGNLILADNLVNCFWHPLYHCLYLLVIGWGAFYSTYLFQENHSPYSRKNFGMAFRRSGIIVLIAATIGITLAHSAPFLVNRILAYPIFLNSIESMALGLALLISSIGIVLSYRFVDRSVWLLGLGIVQTFQLALVAISVFELSFSFIHFTAAASILVLALNILILTKPKSEQSLAHYASSIATPILCMVGILQFICLACGTFTHLFVSPQLWINAIGLGAVTVAGISSLVVIAKKRDSADRAGFQLLSVLVSFTLIPFAICLTGLIPLSLDYSIIVGIFPIVLAIATILHKHNKLVAEGYAAATLGSFVTLALCYYFLPYSSSQTLTLYQPLAGSSFLAAAWLTTFSVAIFAASNSVKRLEFLASICGLLATGLWLHAFDQPTSFIVILPFTFSGVFWQLAYHASKKDGEASNSGWKINVGEIVLNLGFATTVLFAASQLGRAFFGLQNEFYSIALVAIQTVLAGFQAFFYRSKKERIATNTIFGMLLASTVMLGIVSSNFGIGYRIEAVLLLSASALIVLGHWKWLQNPDGNTNLAAGFNIAGTCLLLKTLMVGFLLHRLVFSAPLASWIHELLVFGTGLLLLHTGLLFKFRSTTTGGIILLGTYALSLAMYIPIPEQLKSGSILMIISGGSVFALAVVLSIYRDWLLEVPEKIRKGEGPLKFLSWKR